VRHTHSQRLERWLGRDRVEDVSRVMRGFYWPVALHGVPGNVRVMPGGDFSGEIRGGQEASALDRAQDTLRKHRQERAAAIAEAYVAGDFVLRSKMDRRAHAFASLSALIAARTGGKGCDLVFQKTGVASSAIGGSMDLWVATGQPAAGAAGAAAAAGTAHTSANTGAMGFVNAVANANSSHFVSAWLTASVINNTLLLYDRLFSVAKTMNSTATEAVTGVPTRYQSQTSTASDYIGGNFCFPMNPTTVLAATGHNWTVCQYTDQAGNTANSFPSATGISACPVGQIDLAVGQGSWFMPLASGDVGVKALTQMQASALVATGTISFVVAHPIAFMACPVANLVCTIDGINTAFNLVTVFDNACLSLLEMPKPATTATSYSGQITTVSE
jgi:hypothetical protein